MDELIAFLTARLDEDEAIASAANGDRLWSLSQAGDRVINDAGFMQEFTPARVLREVETKRRIMALHRPVQRRSTGSSGGTVEDCQMCDHFPAQYPCGTLRLLALPYADHPDYREAWRA